MKKIFLLLSFTTLTLQSCSSSDSSSNTPLTVEAVENIATSGTWKVTYFDTLDGGVKTNNYVGYGFTFYSLNNIITAVKGSMVHNGSWALDNSNNKVLLSINFQDPITFQILQEVYDVISINNNKIVLKNSMFPFYINNPSVDPTLKSDNLIFEKI